MQYKKKLGEYGENLAKRYLKGKGYSILSTNYRDSNQEIDIIAKIEEKYIFFEVKTCIKNNNSCADDNMTRNKIINLKKALRAYVNKHKLDSESVQIDFLAIDLDRSKKVANIKHYKDII